MELGKFGRLGAIPPAKILAAMIRKVDDWLSHLLSTVSRPVVAPLGTGPSVPIFLDAQTIHRRRGIAYLRARLGLRFRPVLDAVPATGFIMPAWQSVLRCLATGRHWGP